MKNQADPYGRGGYCIVVALKGKNSDEAEALRNFRDKFLKNNYLGEKFIRIYYNLSPLLARKASENKFLTKILRSTVNISVKFLN